MARSPVQRRISREELAGMTAFATIGDVHMLRRKKRRRGKTARIGVVVTHAACIQCRDMIRLFSYGPNRNIIGTAIVTGLTIVADTRVREVKRRHERSRSRVANDAVLGCRDMISGLSGTDITVVTGHTIVENTHVAKNCPGKGRCT